ncbi:MAG: hypothetical protein IK130_02360 [Oscillospiraceae bacterium]|nr:hypothetical protein [Oscillospiraceae bacterium]
MKKQLIKRTVSAVCAAMMLSGGAALLPANAAEKQAVRLMGDLNGDCKITMVDAKKALDIAVAGRIGLVDNKSNAENNPADIDMNGTIETMDALAILRYFCQSLVGDQPLWSDIRKLTYHDGSDYDPGYYVRDPNEAKTDQYAFEKRGMYVEVGCAEGKPGEEVTVPVYVAGADKINGMTFAQDTTGALILTALESDLGLEKTRVYDPESGYINNLLPRASFTGKGSWAAAVNEGRAAFAWISNEGTEYDFKNGIVVLKLSYKIPEDAKDGDTFVLSADPKSIMFDTIETIKTDEDEYCEFDYYQYTMLDGVIAVSDK